WRIASLARADALCGGLPLHWIAGERQRRVGVLARRLVPPAAQLELAKGRRGKRIAPEAIAGLDRTRGFEPALRTFLLRDGNGAVKCNDRRRAYGHQHVVQ